MSKTRHGRVRQNKNEKKIKVTHLVFEKVTKEKQFITLNEESTQRKEQSTPYKTTFLRTKTTVVVSCTTTVRIDAILRRICRCRSILCLPIGVVDKNFK